MGSTTRVVEHGQAALGALRVAIDELQGGQALSPVTVVVPSNSVGVGARRWLAAHGGIAAVQFLTIHRLAELLGGPTVVAAGRRPVSTPVVDVAVRRALAARPGMFAPVAHHHATVSALRDVHRELRHIPPAALRRLAEHGSPRAREVVRLHLAVSARLAGGWYDEADLLAAAMEHVPDGAAPTVVHLPGRLRPAERALLDALAARTEVVELVGGAPARLDGEIELVDTSDADEEVREVVRRVVAAAAHGVALERIAVVWPVSDPYARLVTEQLDAAGIPWNGRPGVTVHERLAARLVLDVLHLDRRGLRRADLFGVLAHVPARTAGGRRVPAARWERLSRTAGLATGADWDVRLTHYEHDRRAAGMDGDADEAAALRDFVADLRALLGNPAEPARWLHWARLATLLLERWLGGPRQIAALPPTELASYEQVEAAVQRLGRLDEIDGPVTRRVFVDALAAELDAAPARVGRIGDGVQCGPLSFALGQSLEHVFVLGAVEGQLPAMNRADPLLGDADRRLTDGVLTVSEDAVADQRAQLDAAIAAAPRRTVLRPRGDLRTTAERQPTRWLADLTTMAPVTRHTVASFAAGLSDAPFPAIGCHHRVRALVHHGRSGQPIDSHPLAGDVPALRRGLATVRAREADALTEYDGNLAGLAIPSPLDQTVSPTALESWAACPYAYFVRYLLGVRPVELPDAALRIRPVDLGLMIHAALDAFHRRVIDGGLPQPGRDGWTAEHRRALDEELAAAGARMEAAGRVGRPAAWAAAQVKTRHELHRWLAGDGARMAERGGQVVASEIVFGRPDHPGALPEGVIELADGRVVRLAGIVDRVDRWRDGTLCVIDHKTGKRDSYGGIDDDDPAANGTRFQLPAYAAAVRALDAGDPQRPVRAEYSFTQGFEPVGVSFGPQQWQVVADAITRIVDHIGAGMFPAFPPRSQHRLPFVRCEYCDPDHLGTAELYEEHRRKVLDPVLAALAEADGDD